MLTRKATAFWPLLTLLVLADCSTKRLAEEHLSPPHIPHEVVGDIVRFTLAYNPGAAFSFHLGPHSRWIFSILAVVILAVLARIYRGTPSRDVWQATAIALICGGAIGNVLDRLRSPRGVVDFIDVGVGSIRFWTFNIADIGVTVGGLLLAAIIWRRGDPDRQPASLADA